MSVFNLAEADIVIRDASGNAVGVILDGAVYRLQTEAKLTGAIPAGTNNIGDVDVVSSALPAGAATESTLLTMLTESDFNSRINTLGQKTMSASTPIVIASDQTAIAVTDSGSSTSPTFYVVYDRIAPNTNKVMASLFNAAGSGKKVVIYRVSRFNWQVAAVNGATLDQYMSRTTTVGSGATAVTVRSADTADTLPVQVTAGTGHTTVPTEDHIIRRFSASSEETNLSNANFYNALSLDYSVAVYERVAGTRGLVLREGQGLSIRNVTASTIGTVSYLIEFTLENP